MIVLKKGGKTVTLNTVYSINARGSDVEVQIPRRGASATEDYGKLWELGGKVRSQNCTGVWVAIENATCEEARNV